MSTPYDALVAAYGSRDARVCVCGHKCVSHGSFTDGVFRGIGGGQCGWGNYSGPCPCGRFEETPSSLVKRGSIPVESEQDDLFGEPA